MATLLMILGVIGLMCADKVAEILACFVILLFAIYLDGAFDSLLGVC